MSQAGGRGRSAKRKRGSAQPQEIDRPYSAFIVSDGFFRSLLGNSTFCTPAFGTFDQYFGGNLKLLVKSPNHFKRKRTIPTHDFVYSRAMTDNANQRPIIGFQLFKTKSNRIQRIRNIDWITFPLVSLN